MESVLVQEKRKGISDLTDRIKGFMESEARACAMDFGCVTPLYVYRMWDGRIALNDIEEGFKYLNVGR